MPCRHLLLYGPFLPGSPEWERMGLSSALMHCGRATARGEMAEMEGHSFPIDSRVSTFEGVLFEVADASVLPRLDAMLGPKVERRRIWLMGGTEAECHMAVECPFVAEFGNLRAA